MFQQGFSGFLPCLDETKLRPSSFLGVKVATKKSVSLSVGRGEKLPVSKGAGLTEKGREKYNAATGSHLKAPAPNPKTKADQGRKDSFCARMGAVAANAKDGERAKAALKRWKC